MKLRKEQQLISDFIFLKYNDFNLETLEKGSKIMYNMQKYNLISSYSMWKDLTEIYVLTKQELTKEFEKFIIDSFVAFFNKAGLDFLFNMIFSLELLSQDLVAYLFISPEFDLNFVAAIIYKLVMEKQFQYEIEVIMCVKKYSKKLNKNIFNFNIFLEETCRIHLKDKSFSELDELELEVLDFIISCYSGNKKRLSKIIYS